MKYAVMAQLRVETPAKQSGLVDAIISFIGKKTTWGETTILKETDEQGYPITHLTVRFDVKSNMDDLFAFIKDKMATIPVLRGRVTTHACSHDESPSTPCVIEKEYEK